MNSRPVRAAGIPWFRREDYDRILDIMEDRDILPATWAEWRKQAAKAESYFRSLGVETVRAILDPGEFPAWCRARGLKVDGKARIAFGNEAAFDRFGETH